MYFYLLVQVLNTIKLYLYKISNKIKKSIRHSKHVLVPNTNNSEKSMFRVSQDNGCKKFNNAYIFTYLYNYF